MDDHRIDLRSDTVTRPSPEMRRAIAEAPVGDDVLGDDPTVVKLEQELADRLGKEAVIFMPSGTMTNQVAIRLHCQPGDEFICERGCHIYNYEQGAFAQLSGVVAQPVVGVNGMLHLQDVQGLVRRDDDHLVRTRMICLENTHNRSGGAVLPFEAVVELSQWARDREIRMHLDGARLFNAVALGRSALEWAEPFDTVSVCFSKGLGAPVGSGLAGSAALIRQARRHRKLFGGGMRQVGVIAAGALYALRHHTERLVVDHQHAQRLAEYVREAVGITLANDPVETNILFFHVDPSYGSAQEFVKRLQEIGVLTLAESPTTIRALTHLDVTSDQIEAAGRAIQQVAEEMQKSYA